jgi:cobalt/nickel transport system ATP-binding protein
MLEAREICFAYEGKRPVLDRVSFSVQPGERVVLLGVNGSGKTTLLRILDGLIPPTAGSVLYQGRELTPRQLKDRDFHRAFRSEVVLLFQNPDAMIFNPTVYDEIAFGLRQLDLPDCDARVRQWAEKLGLTPYLERAPFRLSSGEKQKVSLAALLALEPKVLLLDEPTASLDPRTTGWLVDLLQDLELTTIVTTHNLSLGSELGERALVLAEDHSLIYDGDFAPLLEDSAKLREANLVHTHRHRHAGVEHLHSHTHDWD